MSVLEGCWQHGILHRILWGCRLMRVRVSWTLLLVGEKHSPFEQERVWPFSLPISQDLGLSGLSGFLWFGSRLGMNQKTSTWRDRPCSCLVFQWCPSRTLQELKIWRPPPKISQPIFSCLESGHHLDVPLLLVNAKLSVLIIIEVPRRLSNTFQHQLFRRSMSQPI